MLRSTLRMFRPLPRTSGTTSIAQITPIWEGLLWRRSFVSRASQIAPRRPSLLSYTPKPKRKPLKSTRRQFHSNARLRDSKATPPKDSAGQEAQGLSARLKKLSREYGWAAVGVYLALSVLDFPFCFLIVRFVGT